MKPSIYETLHTVTVMGFDTWKEPAGETVELLAAASPLRPVRWLSSPPMTSTSVLDVVLAFFVGGAAASAVFLDLDFNAWCFRFMASGIVFDSSTSAILDLN